MKQETLTHDDYHALFCKMLRCCEDSNQSPAFVLSLSNYSGHPEHKGTVMTFGHVNDVRLLSELENVCVDLKRRIADQEKFHGDKTTFVSNDPTGNKIITELVKAIHEQFPDFRVHIVKPKD